MRPPWASMSRRSQAVVVLPLVPVMPQSRRRSLGRPKWSAQALAKAVRGSSTRISQSGLAPITAAAPLARASAM